VYLLPLLGSISILRRSPVLSPELLVHVRHPCTFLCTSPRPVSLTNWPMHAASCSPASFRHGISCHICNSLSQELSKYICDLIAVPYGVRLPPSHPVDSITAPVCAIVSSMIRPLYSEGIHRLATSHRMLYNRSL